MHDQRTFWGAMVTMVIWVALTIISTLFMSRPDVNALGAAIFVVIMAGIGIGGTSAIWEGMAPAKQEALPPQEAARRARKVKHGDRERVARLVEELDGDELVELETLLMAGREGVFDDE